MGMILFFSVTDIAYVDIIYSLQKEENHVENPTAQILTAIWRGEQKPTPQNGQPTLQCGAL